MTTIECERALAKLRREGRQLDDALAVIRQNGATLIASIAAVRAVEEVSLTDAKRIILDSPAWSDRREGYDRFTDSLLEILNEDEPAN